MLARRGIPLILIGATVAWNDGVDAQQPTAADSVVRPPVEESAVAQPTAPVVVDGETLFRVRGVAAYPADRRAADIADRIVELASDRSTPVGSLSIRETTMASSVMAAGRPVLHVIDADASLEGVSRQVLAEAYRGRVIEAVHSFRHDREAAVLGRSAGKALAATIALVLALWLWRTAIRRLRALLDRTYRSRVRDLRYRTFEIARGEQLWRAVHRAVGVVAGVLAIVAVYAYLEYVLLLFPWTRELGRDLASLILRPLGTLGKGILEYAPNLVFLIILALLTRYALEIVRLFFRRVGDGSLTIPGFERDWAQPTDRITRLLVIAFALVIAYPYVPGSGSEAFKGITILIGLLFSLGSSSVISNLVAGQSLAFRRAFRVGDLVRIGEHVGSVAQIRLLTTYLRSPKNEQIVIPNAVILNSDLVNFSTFASDAGVILHTTVSIGYEIPWRQVEALLLEAAARTPGLLRQPPPFVLQKALGTSAVEYEINAHCNDPHAMIALYSALRRNILDAFNEYGVQIIVPSYEGDPDRPKVVPRGEWYAPPAAPAALSMESSNSAKAPRA